MTEMQDVWRDVAGKAEALGLKLKLHLEQEQDEASERVAGDTKARVDELGQKLTDAFESFGNAAKDPAVHQDVKDIGATLKDALTTTFSAVGAEVSSRTGSDDASPQDVVSDEADSGSGDETDGADS